MPELNSVKLSVYVIVLALIVGGSMIMRSSIQAVQASSELRLKVLSRTERLEEAVRRTARGQELYPDVHAPAR